MPRFEVRLTAVPIVLSTNDAFEITISGTFSVPVAAAEAVTADRWAKHGVSFDRELLDWIQSLPAADEKEHRLPAELVDHDRMGYVIADLINSNGEIQITCETCKADVALNEIEVEERDFSSEVNGFRMGFAGDLYSCSEGHGLLFVLTKIF